MSKNRQYRTFALCVMSIVITVGVVYYDGSATSSTENPSAPNRSDDIEIRGASRRAAKPITTKEASDFAVNVDLRERYHKWAEDLSVSTGRQGMGHTANVREQVDVIVKLVREYRPDAETICELGVNLGHSASTILTALNHPRKFVGFDYNDETVVKSNAELQRVFSDVAFTFVTGATDKSVPQFTSSPEGTGLKCDLLHIDAGHTHGEAWADLINSKIMTNNETVVLMDDCGCPSAEAWWCEGVNKAVAQGVSEGLIDVISMGVYHWPAKGTCVVRYHQNKIEVTS